MAAHITPGPRHRFLKRQRDEADDEARTTVERITRGRSTPPAETSTEAEDTTSSSRRRNTSTTTSETPTTTSETTSRTPTRTTSSTTSERTSTTSSTTSSSSPTTSSTTATSSTETSSSSERSTSSIDTTSSRSSASSSAESAVSSDDVGENSNGPIIGAIIAVVAVVAICLAGFLWWKRRKSQQKLNEAGYLPENGTYPDDDDRSFVGGSKNDSMVAANKFDEKSYEPGAFNLQDMPPQNAAAFGGAMNRGAPGGDPRYLSSNNAGFGAPLTYGTYPDPHAYSAAPATPASAHMPHPGYAYGAQQASYDAEQQLYEPEPSPPSPYSPDGYGQASHQQQPMSRDMTSPFADPQQPYHTAENFVVPPIPQKEEQPEMAYQAAGINDDQPQQQGGDDSRGEGPFADPQYVNKLFKVVRTFQPSMSDELKVTFGDRIKILVAYDDGWCLGENLDSASNGSTNIRGVFPRDCVQEVRFNDNNEEQEMRALTPIQDASRPTSPVTPMRNSELYESEPPTAAPTLPPLDIGDRDSQTFDEAAYSTMPSSSASNLHPSYPASHPQTPIIEVSPSGMHDDDNRDAHLSASSSMQDSSVIDHFPQTPTAAMTPGLEESPVQPRHQLDDPNRASQAAKRTSSLLASRDADLFMALGQALDERDLR